MRVMCIVFVLALGACTSKSQVPLGVGGGTDSLKQSPCVCGPLFYQHGQWMS
jgi:hypothetical protein